MIAYYIGRVPKKEFDFSWECGILEELNRARMDTVPLQQRTQARMRLKRVSRSADACAATNVEDLLFDECLNDSISIRENTPKYTIPPKQTGASFIVSLQQANGSWLLNDQLAGVVFKSVEELKSCCPVSCDDAMMANIWATLVVIELLKKKYPSMLDELELVIMKVEQWLSKQVLPSGISLTAMRESAIKTV